MESPAAAPIAVKVDFEKISQRTLALPVPPRNYLELAPGKEGVLLLTEGPAVESASGANILTAQRFDLKTRKTDKLIEGVLAFYISANGEKMLYRAATPQQQESGTPPPQVWMIASLPPAPPAGGAASAPPVRLAW